MSSGERTRIGRFGLSPHEAEQLAALATACGCDPDDIAAYIDNRCSDNVRARIADARRANLSIDRHWIWASPNSGARIV